MKLAKPPLEIVAAIIKKTLLHLILFSACINFLGLALPIYSLQVLDRVLGSSSLETLLYLSLIIFVMLVTMNALTSVRDKAFFYISQSTATQLSEPAFMACFSQHYNRIGTQAIRELQTIRQFLTSQPFGMLFDALWFWIFLSVIFYIHVLPGFLISAAAIMLCLMSWLNHKLLKKDTESLNQSLMLSNHTLTGIVQQSEAVLGMHMQAALVKRYHIDQTKSDQIDASLKQKTRRMTFAIKTFRLSIQVLITMLSAYLIIQGKMSAGAYIAISILSGKVLAPFDASPVLLSSLITVRAAYKRLKDALGSDSLHTAAIDLPEPAGQVAINQVMYRIDQHTIIKPLSLVIEAGDCVGIIGRSGAGKSTVARLLTHVCQPSRGTVCLDGGDLLNWPSHQLGHYIGYLPQDVALFPGTVKDNIAKMGLDYDTNTVLNAAQVTHNHAFIMSLPQGYNTMVSPQSISAGQQQRIALARAFYGPVKVVVLDEPNANLDHAGDQALLATLQWAKSQAITVVIISHKPAILSVTDKILVLDQGEMKQYDRTNTVLAKRNHGQ